MTYKVARELILKPLIDRKSLFLFGPRSTGKTSLLRDQFSESTLVIDLLRASSFLPLSQNPSELESMIRASGAKIVIIDEVQKLPQLLDEVHHLIETTELRFILTGSSSRRLKRQNANMLGGRASKCSLFPFTWKELEKADKFDLNRYLRFGSLPRVYFSDAPGEELYDYVDVYLKDEIQLEAAVRNLPAFSRFLRVAALSSGNVLNYSNVANDVGLSANTIREYFSLLDDTLIGFQLPPWGNAKKRKSIAKAKHYLFDCGVIHALSGTKNVDRNSDLYGTCFEHFIINEVRAYNAYQSKRWELSFWRTDHGQEVDLIINDSVAIEIKSTKKPATKMQRSLELIAEEADWQARILVCQDPIAKTFENGVQQLPWTEFLQKLWDGNWG